MIDFLVRNEPGTLMTNYQVPNEAEILMIKCLATRILELSEVTRTTPKFLVNPRSEPSVKRIGLTRRALVSMPTDHSAASTQPI